MKTYLIVFLLTLSISLLGQNNVAGHYRNNFFGDIQLHADSTFEYNWDYDLNGRWTKGVWTLNNDTVYFHIVPMYDTLSITKSNGVITDTLILSKYSKPRRLTPQVLAEITISSVEQSRVGLPEKMVFKENNLYEIKNGRLVTEKQQGIKRGTEHDPWYFKIYD